MLKLRDLYIGAIDARNELMQAPDHDAATEERFVVPSSLNLEEFVAGRRWFITGMKGTGKTAALYHLAREVRERLKMKTHFVFFKGDLSADDLARLSKIGHSTVTSAEVGDYPDADFQPAWRWFLYRQLVRVAERNSLAPSEKNGEWKRFAEWMKSPVADDEGGVSRFIPKIVKGLVSISATPKLELSGEWNFDEGNSTKLPFGALIRKADDLFSNLGPGGDTICVFIDELELRRATNKQFVRDAHLIGDLMLAIQDVNRRSRERGIGLRVYAAIRSEVLTVVSASGKEVNKPAEDFGGRIVWDPNLSDDIGHPLLQILVKRIKLAANLGEIGDGEVWRKYFPDNIDDDSSEKYVLHRSWFRPRDVIRMLNTTKELYPDSTAFGARELKGASKAYSNRSWVELQEELSASYSAEDIQAIYKILRGMKRSFFHSDFSLNAERLADKYSDVGALVKARKMVGVLEDLYRVGVIGNLMQFGKTVRPRFEFRGDDGLLLDKEICVHKALRQHLSIG